MVVECGTCEAFVEAQEIGGYEYLRRGDKPSGRYLMLRCLRCESPLLVGQDNVGNQIEGDIWDTPVRMYPAAEQRVNPDAPKAIRAAYGEAVACFRAKAYTATAIMCRKTLEGVAAVHGAAEKTFMRSLDRMRSDGLIDERLFEWANLLRMAGNEAAHDVGVTFSREDASDMLDFTGAIIDYLFSFRDKFDRFRARRRP